jgi:F0F1-type ATP synthase membrane subunit b/b'
MKNLSRAWLLPALLAFHFSAFAQGITPTEIVGQTVALSKAVHFSSSEGGVVEVPPGAYWVAPVDDELVLFTIESGETFQLRAVSGMHDEELAEDVAVSIPGTDEQPDVHTIAYLAADGTELTAEGTYSGIQPRGLLGDAKKKADAARREAARRAALAKQRAQQLAEQARQQVEAKAAEARRNARKEVGRILEEVAATYRDQGRNEAVQVAVRNGPRLTAMSAASFSARQRVRLIAEATRQLREHMPFIKEVVRRAATVRPLLKEYRSPINEANMSAVRDAIWGSGEDLLIHPFANRAVTARGIGDGFGPSWAIGGSGDISAIAGLQVGGAVSQQPLGQNQCGYVSASFDLGAQAGGSAVGTIGFFTGRYDALGASSLQGWVDGFEVAVNLGVAATVGAEVTLLFGWPSEELAYIPLTGIQIGLGAGGEAEASVALGYGIRLFCT